MSVLIKGMDMPKRCEDCPFKEYKQGRCKAYRDLNTLCKTGDKPEWCPLVEMPTPHGRLIDARELQRHIHEHAYAVEDGFHNVDWGMFTHGIDYLISITPTIIEAEEDA